VLFCEVACGATFPFISNIWVTLPQVSSKDVASIIGPHRMSRCSMQNCDDLLAGGADSPFALSSQPTPPPPPPEWMDPDVHDTRQQQQRQNAPSPSAIEAIIAAAAAQAGKSDEFNISSSFHSTSGLNEVLCLSCAAMRQRLTCSVCRRDGEVPNKLLCRLHQQVLGSW
jgi:hypothetical protein